MNKEELLKILKENHHDKNRDFEEAHISADDALIAFIDDKEIDEAYYNVGKWYA